MQEKFIEIEYKGKKLKIASCQKKNSNEWILLLHGLQTDKRLFENIFEDKDFNKFSIIAIDLIGFGNSSKPEDFSYNIEEQAEICKLRIKKLNLTKIHIIGHSMGGMIAVFLMQLIPEKIVSVVNIEGNLIKEDCGKSKDVAKLSFNEFKDYFIDFKKELKNSNEPSASVRAECISKAADYAFYKTSKSIVDWSNSGKLLSLFLQSKIKRFYFYSENTPNKKILKLLKNKIPLIKISKSGHFMILDNPREFYKKLYEILPL